MALTDDNFSPSELKMLYQFAKSRNIDKEELDEILLTHTDRIIIPEKVETKIEYLYDLAKMIWADGIVTSEEEETLRKYCLQFGFLEENIDQLAQYLLENAEKEIPHEEIINQLKS
jgi:uncharacterized tellurite resistance protein B-like protein